MHITILMSGSRGDVQPYVALALGLRKAGYLVHFAAQEPLRELVDTYGLEFIPIGADINVMLRDEKSRGMLAAAGRNPLFNIGQIFRLARMTESLAFKLLQDAWHACQNTEAILCASNNYYAGAAIAEKLGCPLVCLSLLPLAPTRFHPSILFSPLPTQLDFLERLGYNWATHAISWHLFWQMIRPWLNRIRKRVLDLPPRPIWLSMKTSEKGPPRLYGFSSHVIYRPPDWPPIHHVTGCWFLDPPDGWQPPAALRDFLEAGSPPVYIGFGSMIEGQPEALTEIVIQALQRARQRGILTPGWGGLVASKVPTDVFIANDIPHAWLFPRVAAVVHHGGAGTTVAALRAGVPSVVIPFITDQFFWGRRAYALGVGPRPLGRKKLSVEQLATAIKTAVEDREIRERAQRLGQQIRGEDGVTRAIEVIAQYGIIP
jgi:sterol 3beta-glucosyltransferase